MYRLERLDSPEFKDYMTFHQKVDSIAAVDPHVAIDDR